MAENENDTIDGYPGAGSPPANSLCGRPSANNAGKGGRSSAGLCVPDRLGSGFLVEQSEWKGRLDQLLCDVVWPVPGGNAAPGEANPSKIDVLVRDIPGATNGFRLLFSAQPFPGHQKKLTWLRGDMGGNYYKMEVPPMEGWICPAMFRYYKTAPQELYVKAEPKK